MVAMKLLTTLMTGWTTKMRTIPTNQAHTSLTTKHQTMKWISDTASVSIRKTNGRYTVRVENFDTQQVFRNSYATLPGALVCAENLVEYYL